MKNIYVKNNLTYITSDESLKQGEQDLGCYYSDWKGNVTRKNNTHWENTFNNEFIKKVVLTSDADLIADGVQSIGDRLLAWLLDNPNCENIEVVSELKCFDKHGLCVSACVYDTDYTKKVYYAIPKEEPKQSVQEYEQQGLEKYSHELKQETIIPTAVEWFNDHLELVSSGHAKIESLFNQAKEMEKEQKLEPINKAIKLFEEAKNKAESIKDVVYLDGVLAVLYTIKNETI